MDSRIYYLAVNVGGTAELILQTMLPLSHFWERGFFVVFIAYIFPEKYKVIE